MGVPAFSDCLLGSSIASRLDLLAPVELQAGSWYVDHIDNPTTPHYEQMQKEDKILWNERPGPVDRCLDMNK